MGTYTDFKMNIHHTGQPAERCKHAKPKNAKFCPECGLPNTPIDLQEQLIQWAEAHEKDYEVAHYMEALVEYGEITEVKWYGHDGDMRAVSQAFPDVLFVMTCRSEEERMWRSYYKNGKAQTVPAVITYDPFDPEKLK